MSINSNKAIKIEAACTVEVALETVEESLSRSPYRWVLHKDEQSTGYIAFIKYREVTRAGGSTTSSLIGLEQYIRLKINASPNSNGQTTVELKYEDNSESSRFNAAELLKYTTENIRFELKAAANRYDAMGPARV